MHAAVHAHAADRAVDVRRIAGKDGAASAEVGGDALVHGVGRAMHHFIGLIARQKALQLRLDEFVAEDFFRRVIDIGRKVHAPAFRLRPFEQVGPLLRVGEVIAVGVTVILVEIVANGDGQRAFGVGVALELDAERFAHDAAAAFGADDVTAADGLFIAGGIGDDGFDAVAVLRERHEFGRHADIAHLRFTQYLHGFVDDLGALALEHVWKARVVLQHRMIKLGEHRIGFAIPVLHGRRNQTALFKALIQAEVVEHFERDRVDAAGARLLIQKALRIEALDHGGAQAVLRQIEREADTNRPRTGNDDGLLCCRHCLNPPALRFSPRRASRWR